MLVAAIRRTHRTAVASVHNANRALGPVPWTANGRPRYRGFGRKAAKGDTTTMKETLAETAEDMATVLEREAEKALPAEPQAQVSDTPVAEIVANKAYHSSDVVITVEQAQARTYIPEPKRGDGRRWRIRQPNRKQYTPAGEE